MTERTYRFVLGAALTLLLYFHLEAMIFVYIGVLLWEALTGWRVPVMVSRLRYGPEFRVEAGAAGSYRFAFEAERGMRLVFACVLTATFYGLSPELWYLNWLIAIALFLSGMVNFCPMVVILRWLGFR